MKKGRSCPSFGGQDETLAINSEDAKARSGHLKITIVAAGILPAVEPGILPGGMALPQAQGASPRRAAGCPPPPSRSYRLDVLILWDGKPGGRDSRGDKFGGVANHSMVPW
jgi:hypothetical protein